MLKLSLLGGLAAMAAAVPAAATTIDFNSLHSADGGYTYTTGAYHEDGYTLTADRCSNQNCFTSVQSFQSIDPTGAAIFTNIASTTSRLTLDTGGLFTLSSFDVSEYWDDLTYGTGTMSILLGYTFADGTTSSETRTFNTRGRYPVTTLAIDSAPLRSFSFLPTTGTSGSLQYDNFIVNAVTSAVPEAPVWAMMLTGFGLAGHAMRRRASVRRTVQAV